MILVTTGGNMARQRNIGNVILVTGDLHIGKTTLISDFLETPLAAGFRVAGILAKGLWKDNLRDGFDLVDLSTGRTTPLARRRKHQDPIEKIMFDFFDHGMQVGAEALSPAVCKTSDIVIVDEVGKLEARGKGWADHLDLLLDEKIRLFIWVVRKESLEQIIDRFQLDAPVIVDVQQPNALQRLMVQVKRRLADPPLAQDDGQT